MQKTLRIRGRKYILKLIAEGSFTSIYSATHGSMTVPSYVIKEIKKNTLITKKRLLEEQHILKSLGQYPTFFPKKIVSGQINGVAYLGYKYLEGETLFSKIQMWSSDVFTLNYCCDLLQKLLTAINILHQRNPIIVHSDISPENILLHLDQLYLLDFGCAQRLSDSKFASKWIGKPSYLSPEQARAENWREKSDIYQAGIIFYECLTGKKWNIGTSSAQKTAFASNPTPHSFTNVPIKLRPLLRAMLQPSHKERIESIDMCLKRLDFAMRSIKEFS